MLKGLIILVFLLPLNLVAMEKSGSDKNDKKIAKLYKKKCSKCHGKNGEGIKNKKKKPPINMLGKMDDKKLFNIIRDGYKGKIGKMPALKKKYANDGDVKKLIKFIRAMDKGSKK